MCFSITVKLVQSNIKIAHITGLCPVSSASTILFISRLTASIAEITLFYTTTTRVFMYAKILLVAHVSCFVQYESVSSPKSVFVGQFSSVATKTHTKKNKMYVTDCEYVGATTRLCNHHHARNVANKEFDPFIVCCCTSSSASVERRQRRQETGIKVIQYASRS